MEKVEVQRTGQEGHGSVSESKVRWSVGGATRRCNRILYCIVLYCIVCCIAWYCIVMYCIVLCCIELYCVVLCCIVLCTVLCCDVMCVPFCCVLLYCTICIELCYLVGGVSGNADLDCTGAHVIVDDRVGLLEHSVNAVVQCRRSVLFDQR